MNPPRNIQQMFDTMVEEGCPRAFAEILLSFRYNHKLPWTFGNVKIGGVPTTVALFPRIDGGQSVIAVVTDDMLVEGLDGKYLDGPRKDKMN